MPRFGTGAIGPFPKNTTYRAERVSQAQAMQMTANKKAMQLAIAKGKPMVESNIRPQPQDSAMVMPEQTKQTLRAAARMTSRIPFGTKNLSR